MIVPKRVTSLFIGSLGLASLLAIFGALASATVKAQTYVTPPTSPFSAGGPVAPALNSSLNSQRKTGSLGIGQVSNPKKLCLNATSVDDTTAYCIQSWGDLSGQFGGPFVSLSQDSWSLMDPSVSCSPDVPRSLCISDYTTQNGSVDLKALSSPAQTFSLVADSSALNLCVLGQCQAVTGDVPQGQTCRVSSDCGFNTTAVYGTNASDPANTAGYFSGVVEVLHPTGSAVLGRICLNGGLTPAEKSYDDPTGGTCISSWSEVTGASTALYVKRQASNPPTVQQSQGAAISGVLNVGSAIVGDSPASSYTCGDGFCSSTETAASCPIDCYTIPTPTFSVAMSAGKVNMTVTTKTQQPAGNVGILIVRTPAATSTFSPVNGVSYTVGEVIGSATVVYVGSVAQNTTVIPQDTLPGSGLYSYRAWQANAYPRYGAPVDRLLGTVYQLTVTVSPSSKGTVGSDDGQIVCFQNSSATCHGLYLDQTPVVLMVQDTIPPYGFQTWSGCDSSTVDQCNLLMNKNRGVTATFTVGGGF